jgi:hypothetical protein
MTKRRRLTGRERREERRRARQPVPWLTSRLAFIAGAGAVAVVAVTFLLVLVLSGGGGVESRATVVTPTPTVDKSGPPAADSDPVFSHTGVGTIDLEVGSGEEVVAGKTLIVNYTGWLSDGTKFNSSFDNGAPFQFTLGTNQVISGWEEGVLGMKEGGKRRLIIPAELGYGVSGFPPLIPPNADLTFDIELIDVSDAAVTPTPDGAATPTPAPTATP